MALKTNNTARFNAIMNSRIAVSKADVGQVLRLTVTSVTYGFYDEANDMMKDIYNTNGGKMDIVQSDWFKEQYAQALELEKAGDTDAAKLIFDDLLNKTTVTFSTINSNGLAVQFAKDEIVNCPIILVDTKDDRQSIAVGKPYAIKVIAKQKGGFNFTEDVVVAAPKPEASALAGAKPVGA